MSKLEELIQQYCPDGVEYKPLGDVCDIHKGVQFNKSDMKDEGTYPVINGGMNPSGYVDVFNEQENTITISQGGASAGYVNFLLSKFWLGAHCYAVKPSKAVMNRYVYHFIKQNELTLQQCQYGAGIPALAKGTITALEIPVPPLPVQEEIVRILDTFTELQAELQAELQKRLQQYNYYRDNLLSFEGRTDVEWKKLGDIATVTKLAGFEFSEYMTYSNEGNIIALRGLNVKNGALDLTDVKYIDNSNFSKLSRSKLYVNDLLYTYVGTVGQVALVDQNDKYYLAPNVALIRLEDTNILSKFLCYYLLSDTFKGTQLNALTAASSMKNITMEKIRLFKIPVLSLPEQQRIVDILDRFDSLTNDLTAGLPAEIEKRKQQYEYYRDKLLTFKHKQ